MSRIIMDSNINGEYKNNDQGGIFDESDEEKLLMIISELINKNELKLLKKLLDIMRRFQK